jgi:hypothetical protein
VSSSLDESKDSATSEARTRQGRGVSRIGYVSDTDTPGIRPGYVSTAYPRIPSYLGWKLTIGNVSAESIRPSRPNNLPRRPPVRLPYSRLPTPRSRPRAAASASASRSRLRLTPARRRRKRPLHPVPSVPTRLRLSIPIRVRRPHLGCHLCQKPAPPSWAASQSWLAPNRRSAARRLNPGRGGINPRTGGLDPQPGGVDPWPGDLAPWLLAPSVLAATCPHLGLRRWLGGQ